MSFSVAAPPAPLCTEIPRHRRARDGPRARLRAVRRAPDPGAQSAVHGARERPGEIHAAVGRTSDSMGWGLMIAALLPGPLLAASAALAARRGRLSTRGLLMIMLGLLALGTPIYLVASFPAGMTLADTFGVGGADHAPWARILHTISQIAALALAATIIHRAATRRPRPAPVRA
ncbi:hypothetical protein [Brachybacterium sp. GPGPB12]|uniref:hypothetical protein n=1 Tax=Brachybacterium sp. GPGPB12 TaxID=3023517 RepID=UPI0031343245